MNTLRSVPTLDEIARDPSQAAALSPEVIRAIFGQVVLLQTALLPYTWRADAPAAPGPHADDWISLADAAALIGRPTSWLLRRSPRPVWLRRLGRKTFLVNRPALLRWLDSRPS